MTLFYSNRNLACVIRDMYDVQSAYTQLKNGLRIETSFDVNGDWIINILRSDAEITDNDILKIKQAFTQANIALPEMLFHTKFSVAWAIDPDEILPRLI